MDHQNIQYIAETLDTKSYLDQYILPQKHHWQEREIRSQFEYGIAVNIKERLGDGVDIEKIYEKLDDLMTFVDGDGKDIQKHITETTLICVEKDIAVDELSLLKTTIEQNLESSTRRGVSIIDYQDSIEIRGDGKKFLLEDEASYFRYLFNVYEQEDDYKQLVANEQTDSSSGGVDYFGTPRIKDGDYKKLKELKKNINSFTGNTSAFKKAYSHQT